LINELFNSMDLYEKADMVFQELPGNIYVMLKNRKGVRTDLVYELIDLDYFKSHGVKVWVDRFK
jgi:hypothetical protein